MNPKPEDMAMRYTLIGSLFLTLAILVVIAPPQLAAQERDAEVLLQQAMHAEQVEGDLEQAISLYRELVEEHGNVRPVAASALLRLGLCYEKLGREEAANAYERLLADYADQGEMVTEARVRLAVLRAAVAATTSEGLVARRLLEDDGCGVSFMRPSPDGTRLAYTDACKTMAVHIRDVASGSIEQLTSEGMHFGIAWSPDGRRIATAELYPREQLKIIDIETGNIEELDLLAGEIYLPDDWSPDGEHLSCTVTNKDRSRSSVVVSLRTGERFTLADRVAQQLARAAFSPDGRHVAFTDFTGDNQDIYVVNVDTRERFRVTNAPEVDDGAVWSPDGTTLLYHNPNGTWAIRVADGRAEGSPRLVRSKRYGTPLASNTWRPTGYYYASMNMVTHAYRIPVDPETAQPLGVPELIPEPVPGLDWRTQFAWSPDMERVASTGGEDPHYIHVARGQSVTSFHLGDEASVWGMWWSVDGTEILYTTRRDTQRERRRTVNALDPRDGNIRELFPALDSISHVHVSADRTRMVFLRPLQVPREDAPTAVGELVVSEVGNPADGRVLASSSHDDGWLATQITQPVFSPDGSQILFFRVHEIGEGHNEFEMSLWVVPVDGSGPARQLARASQIPMAYWDPSGQWIAFQELHGSDGSDMRGSISVISVETGAKHEILGQEGMEAMELSGVGLKAVSPDGRWVGIAAATGGFEYWVVEDPLGGNARAGGGW
jgi:Tol biopolymer transport system component